MGIEMTMYIGTKIIHARPCTVDEFNSRVRPLHYSGESQGGYLVEYEDGYLSWSPKEAFEKAYRGDENLTFGHALELVLKHRKKISRRSWNAPGQYVTLIPAGNAMHQGYPMKDCFGLKNAQGYMVPGWVPTQGDMTSEDWYVSGEW